MPAHAPWPRLARWRLRRRPSASLVGLGVLGSLLVPRAAPWLPGLPALPAAFSSWGSSARRGASGAAAHFPEPRHGLVERGATGTLARDAPAPALSERSLQARVQRAFDTALAALLPDASPAAQVVVADARFGDYQCNNAMGIFKQQPREAGAAPRWKSPRDVGDAVKALLPLAAAEMLDEVGVAPQGFITVKLGQRWLEAELRRSFDEGHRFRAAQPQRIVIDYSSPNIAKEMHVGHLRSTILGDTAASLLSRLGHDVVRLNHVGDWGTQFGMLLEFMRRQEELQGDFAIGDLQVFYRSAKKVFDEDPDFRKAAQGNVVALQAGEAWAREAWSRICDASRGEFDEVYRRLGVQGLEERGESFYNGMLADVVQQLGEKGLVQEDGGAKCIFTSAAKAPLIVQKADGGYGYDSTDCAAVLHRLTEEKADRVIYVIDNGQETHMRMVFEVADKAGWLQGRRLDFMGFGLVQGEDGKKFKTRSGDVVKLKDLLDEAAGRAAAELRQRLAGQSAEGAADERSEELGSNAEQIGIAAVKYFDLRQNRNSDYRFSYDAMLDPKGNTAVYVLYAYARIAGILRKASAAGAAPEASALQLAEPSERALALRLLRLPEVLAQVEEDLLPSRLIEYVYALAGDFTAFYTTCPVLNTEHTASRLVLCEATRRALKETLSILGIEPLEKL